MSSTHIPPVLAPAPAEDEIYVFPASSSQQRLFLLEQMAPARSAYHLPIPLRIRGRLDASALQRTLQEIVRRHETLRTVFGLQDGEVVQIISARADVPLPVIDFQNVPAGERETRALGSAEDLVREPFSLTRGPLFRASLIRLAPDDHLLVLNMHHIVGDGWSHSVVMKELGAIYAAYCRNQAHALADLPIQYADYAAWQRDRLHGEALTSLLGYWNDRLHAAPRQLTVRPDRARPAVEDHTGATETIILPSAIVHELDTLARHGGATAFMLYYAAFCVFLRRYTGETDIVVGSPIMNRPRVELEDLVGFFANTLILRADLEGDPPFREFLGRIRDRLVQDYAHQELPFERLVEELQPDRDAAYNPLFQVMFIMQRAFIVPPVLPGLEISHLVLYRGGAPVDLSIHLVEKPEGMRCSFEYETALYDRDTICRMLGHFARLLEGIAADPDCRVNRLPLLPREERSEILTAWNATAGQAGEPEVFLELLRRQVERLPDEPALGMGDRLLTYREVHERSNQVAHWLLEWGIAWGDLIGVCMERTPELPLVLLGILKSGAAYLPLDPDYPPARLTGIIEDSGARLVLASPAAGAAVRVSCTTVVLDGDAWKVMGRQPTSSPAVGLSGDDLAYVMYTSGSTGVPKGVEISHRALANLLIAMRERPGVDERDVLLAITTVSFDIAGLELFLPLTVGGRVVLVARATAADGRLLVRELTRLRPTIMQATPSTWQALLDAGWTGSPGLRVLCGGEALSRPLADALCARSRDVWNMYGPTETTIWSTVWQVGPGPIMIGRPIRNTRTYVLDEAGEPLPVGVPGELCIAGDGVARGYRNRPELTKERFMPDRFAGEAPARLYRTGDLVRWHASGELEWLGRSDSQVKIRGMRIELGEIESALGALGWVKQCVAVVHGGSEEEKTLVAYVVPGEGGMPPLDEVRASLHALLPDQMVPTTFVVLDRLPRMPNGKIDRHALPTPEVRAESRKAPMAPPSDALQMQLLNIWEKVIGVHPIGIDDNYFDLGGHSVLAVRLFGQIERLTGKQLPLATLFQAPTVRLLADVLRREGWEPPWSSLVPIRPGGSRPPFYGVHGVGGNIVEFFDLARYMDPDQPFYGIQAQGLDGKRPRHVSVEEMAAHYIGEIRAFQPRGPYFFGGSSFGGLVAYEMARQLHALGEQVAFLGLFDTNAPGYPRYLSARGSLRRRMERLAFRIDLHWSNFRVARGWEKVQYVGVKLQRLTIAQRRKAKRISKRLRRRVRERLLPSALRKVRDAGMQAFRSYEGKPYNGPVTLFRATVQPFGIHPDGTNGWNRFAQGELAIIDVPGHHGAIMREPRVKVLAAHLRAALATSETTAEDVR